jgi:hypothetical protein
LNTVIDDFDNGQRVGAMAIIGDLVKSTPGPKGTNKILQSMSTGDIGVTNNGATTLEAVQLDNVVANIRVLLTGIYMISSETCFPPIRGSGYETKSWVEWAEDYQSIQHQ